MIRITWAALDQIDGLLEFYIDTKDRPEAAARLVADLAEARQAIVMAPEGGADFPRPYPSLRRLRFRWIMVRAYWISWRDHPDGPIITNVLHVQADIERRACPESENVQEW